MGRTAQKGQDGSLRAVGRLRVAGRYRLVEKLGTGGMSVVWRGYDEVLGRHVAVKVLSPRLAGDVSFRDRLHQEALAAAGLVHPHITGIFDFGEYPLTDRLTVPYVVMELNDGESVAARVRRQGSLSWREAVVATAEVASALATAHARGLVHRDVTPANVMLTGNGAKVVDFGISAAVGQRDAAPDGSLLGTPAYLAPERLGGAQVSAATDVYALGLLLYRSVTGRLPWPAETAAEALRAHLYADPEPLPPLPGMPGDVWGVCRRCLAKDPADRPAAAEVARSLAALVGLDPVIPPLAARNSASAPARGTAPPVPPAAGGPPQQRPNTLSYLGRAALAYLGLPGGTPDPHLPSSQLRLRAGLRIGNALGMGSARALGGGLFAGGVRGIVPGHGAIPAERRRPAFSVLERGRAVASVLSAALPSATRHRLSAMLVTGAMVLSAGVAWSAERQPQADDQVAGADRVAGAAQSVVCAVRYQLRRDSGSAYEAQLTVAAIESVAAAWRVQFLYPGTQRLTSVPRAVTQKGRKVIVRGHGKLKAFTLRGDYSGVNALPIAFSLDGHRCRAEVLGSVIDSADEGAVSEAAGPEKVSPDKAGPSRGQGGGAAQPPPSEPEHSHGHHRSARSRPDAGTGPPTQTPDIPQGRKGGGFSLAF